MSQFSKRDYYLGNSNLKRAGVKQEYTKDELAEYILCAKNPVYFINKYYKMITLDHGLKNITLTDYQENIANTIYHNNYTIVLAPRQSRKTSTIGACVLHHAIFNADKTATVFANKEKTAIEILNKISIGLENLPFFLQPGMKAFSKTSVEFDNNSRILTFSTTSSSARSFSSTFVYLDEFAWVDNDVEFYTSVYPIISSGKTSKVVISSTPNGLNLFYRLWSDAQNKTNRFVPIEIKWQDVPDRDDAWKEETISNTSRAQFEQESECRFVGAAGTLFSNEVLLRLTIEYVPENDHAFCYETPIPHHQYLVCVDVSRGVGRDYSAASIIDITEKPYKQVYTYYNNTIPPIPFSSVLEAAAKRYNDAYILVENNDLGQQVLDELNQTLEYENIISIDRKLGIKTTKKTKLLGCLAFKNLVSDPKGPQLIVNDANTINEMTRFVSKKNGSFGADKEEDQDDLVMTLVIFSWFEKSKYFEMILEELKDKESGYSDEQISTEDLPPGIFTNDDDEYADEREMLGLA